MDADERIAGIDALLDMLAGGEPLEAIPQVGRIGLVNFTHALDRSGRIGEMLRREGQADMAGRVLHDLLGSPLSSPGPSVSGRKTPPRKAACPPDLRRRRSGGPAGRISPPAPPARRHGPSRPAWSRSGR